MLRNVLQNSIRSEEEYCPYCSLLPLEVKLNGMKKMLKLKLKLWIEEAMDREGVVKRDKRMIEEIKKEK